MIVLVGSEKGGTGKSTISSNLAVMRAMTGKDVLLVDGDPQQSNNLWAGSRNINATPNTAKVTCMSKTGDQAGYDIVNMVDKFDDIIIDAGGRDSRELRSFLVICDYNLISVCPSQYDTWTIDKMDELIRTTNSQRHLVNLKPLRSAVVINRASPNPSLKEHLEIQEYVGQFEETMEMVKHTLFDRVVFRKAVKDGKAVVEMFPRDEKAIHELSMIYKHVFKEAYKPKKSLMKGVA